MSQSAFSSPPVHSLLRHIHLCEITDNFCFAVGNGNKYPIKLFYPVYFLHFNFFFSCCNCIFSCFLVTASVMTHFLKGIIRRSSSQIWCYAHLIDLNLHVMSFPFFFFFPCPNRLCRCPPGHMIRVNGTRKSCVYTLCATRPCHRGTCVAQSPSKFTCHCPEGYRGRHCEMTLAIYREDVGLSFSSLFAICICFMALLGSYCIHHRLHIQEIIEK